jgi:hypothetical protein
MFEGIRAVLNGFDPSNLRPATRRDVADWLTAYARYYGWSDAMRNLRVEAGCLDDWHVLVKSCRIPALHGVSAINLIVPVHLSACWGDLGHSKICKYLRHDGELLGDLVQERHRYWSLHVPDGVVSLIPQDVKVG